MTGYAPDRHSANFTAKGFGAAYGPLKSPAVQYPARPSINSPQGGGPEMGVTGGPPGSVAPGGPSLPGQPMGAMMPNPEGGAFAMDPSLMQDEMAKLQGGSGDGSGAPPTAQQATGIGAFGMHSPGAVGIGRTGQTGRPSIGGMGGGMSGFGANGLRTAARGMTGGAFSGGLGRR